MTLRMGSVGARRVGVGVNRPTVRAFSMEPRCQARRIEFSNPSSRRMRTISLAREVWPGSLVASAPPSLLRRVFTAPSSILEMLTDPDVRVASAHLSARADAATSSIEREVLLALAAALDNRLGEGRGTEIGGLRRLGEQAAMSDALPFLRPRTARVLLAALASARGYAFALQAAPRVLGGEESRPRLTRSMALLAMRTVIEKGVSAQAISWLVRPISSSDRVPLKIRLVPAAVALRHAATVRQTGGTILLLSRIVQTLFADGLARKATQAGYSVLRQSAVRAFMAPELSETTHEIVDILGGGRSNPWDHSTVAIAGDLGLDLPLLHDLISKALGSRSAHIVWPVYLDVALLRALMFALAGQQVSARTYLVSIDDPTAWPSAVSAVHGVVVGERTTSAALLWATLEPGPRAGIKRLYSAVVDLPEPSIAFGTPIWELEEERANAGLVLARAGKLGEFRRLRRLLSRADARKVAEPLWLLNGKDRAAYADAVRVMTASVPQPRPRYWRQLAERIAADVLSRRGEVV